MRKWGICIGVGVLRNVLHDRKRCDIVKYGLGQVAQWIRASDYGSEGRGFESLLAHYKRNRVVDKTTARLLFAY